MSGDAITIRGTEAALVAALLLTAAVFLTTPLTPANGGFDFDGVFYAAMAGSPQVQPQMARVAPWAYRVATPALVALLPVDTLTGFRIVAFAASVVSLVLIFVILKALGFADRSCWIGMVLFAGVFWTLKFSFYAPAYIDIESEVCLLAIVYLTIKRRYVWLIPIVTVAVLQKESLAAFSIFAVTALLREQRVTPRSGLVAAALVLAPLGMLGVVRATVPTMTAIDTGQETREQLRLLLTPGFWPILLQSMFSGLGLLAVVIAMRPRGWLVFARRHYEWIVYAAIALALLLGGRDKGRLFLYLLPAAVVFAVMAIEDMEKRTEGAVVWVIVLLALHAYLGGYLTPMGTVEEYLARLVPEHSEGAYWPFLVRNAAVAAGFVLFTVLLFKRKNSRKDA